MAELDLVLMGPPGASKGTQGRLLGEALGVPCVSSGDLLRHAVEEGSALGEKARGFMARGDLVPDRVIVGLMSRRLREPDARGGFIADGYPRTVPQAEALASALDALGRRLTAALAISLPDDEVVDRLAGRRTCPACGRVYHVQHEPPARAGHCDTDGKRLIQREDDSPATIRRRLAVYHQDSEPLLAHYSEQGLLLRGGRKRPLRRRRRTASRRDNFERLTGRRAAVAQNIRARTLGLRRRALVALVSPTRRQSQRRRRRDAALRRSYAADSASPGAQLDPRRTCMRGDAAAVARHVRARTSRHPVGRAPSSDRRPLACQTAAPPMCGPRGHAFPDGWNNQTSRRCGQLGSSDVTVKCLLIGAFSMGAAGFEPASSRV